jgi:hypothetical protein
VLDTLKAAGLLDSQRTGGRRRARDVEEDSAVSGPSPEAEEQAEPEVRTEAVPESVQWRVEAPQRLRTEETSESSIDMFDSPAMVQPAVRDDVPPVGLGAAFVKGPVIPTARVPQPPDFPPPPVPDFASPSLDFPAMVTVPEQGTGMDAESRTVDESTPEPPPEPDQVPTVPEPDQVPPVPVPDPVPSNPSPEVAPPSVRPVQPVQPVPSVESAPSPASPIGATGFLSAADVERDDAPAEIPNETPAEIPTETSGNEPTGGQADTPAGVMADGSTAPTVDAPVADAPTAPTADTSATDTPAADTPAVDTSATDTSAVDTSVTDTPAEDPAKDPFVTAVVVGGKTIDLPAIVEPTPPALDSPSVTRASRRHKSDLSLAELLAEALVAYEDARREDEAAGRVDEDTVPITPVGPPPESAAETTAPIQRVEPAPRFDTWTLPES